jgi:hypothetical protein
MYLDEPLEVIQMMVRIHDIVRREEARQAEKK